MNRLDRIITRRRLQGKIIGFICEKEGYPYSCNYAGHYYTLHMILAVIISLLEYFLQLMKVLGNI